MRDPCASEYRPSMYRWQVMDLYDRSTRTLADNLVVAGALCAAFELGADWQFMLIDPEAWPNQWRPGCGREAPR